ncbi:hypothetical protein [Streptomyces chromofuscus]|uniref:Uncharacterized protein n=1 Tax=Streptomyces chromofuscus TaxID=42881 RepID=A0A7M2T2X2_STRCW|nr:hypothetical protein [Streptomyces chromofuscus]QOV43037.1 hypothetical protein IPT68_25125 [Streptomyces chromofuscus]GGS93248.1 membrane protein [Streptomyces chromofuscus]
MTHLSLSFGAAPDLSVLLAVGIPVAVLALVLTGWAIHRRGASPQKKRSGIPAVKVAALAALGCTAYSADTSWRFAADYLDMAGTAERAGMFAAAELALFATALMARQNLSVQGAPGLPGTLVWVITGVQVIPAYAESGPIGGTVRAFVGPIMAAMLWHLAMGIELRLRTPGAASHGLLATLGREARERLLSRLGIAARDRDAAQITRDRATARAVALAARLAERTPDQRTSRRGRRLARRLSKAIGRASVGTDPAQRAELLNQLAARRHALALATVPLPSPWSPHSSGEGLVPEPIGGTAPLKAVVPSDGPRPHAVPGGDRSAQEERGPVPGTDPAPGSSTVPKTGDREAGTVSTEAGTEASEPGTDRSLDSGEGIGEQIHEVPAQHPGQDRGPTDAESGTAPTGDRGPTDTDTDTGTNPTGDRGHKVPLRRKPTVKAKGKRGGRSRNQQTQRPSRELQASVDQLVKQVRPHVPALLERDGNETVTRVQLREILRREGLTGGRNDRLSLVLRELRSDATATTTRSTAR